MKIKQVKCDWCTGLLHYEENGFTTTEEKPYIPATINGREYAFCSGYHLKCWVELQDAFLEATAQTTEGK